MKHRLLSMVFWKNHEKIGVLFMIKKIHITSYSVALAALLSANALADISLSAGEWESESVLFVDGVKLNTSKSYHCNGKPVPVLKPEDYAYTVVKDGTGDEWDCSLEARNNPQFDHSFNFSCTTAIGAKSDGEVNFLYREKSYKTEIYSKSHMTDPATGRPLSPKLISSHLTINGRWLSDKCVHSSVEESDS
jgi:hypothetical protein